jgi:tetratricopeptide (TPR) repeat protein
MHRFETVWAARATRTVSSALLVSMMSAGIVPVARAAAAPAAAVTKTEKAPTATELAEAKKHFSEGERAFDKGDFKEALEHFQSADAIKAAPATTRYVALCLDRLGQFRDAAIAFESFIGAAHGVTKPSKNLPKQIEEAETRLAEIKNLPAKLRISATPEGTAFKLDDQAAEAKAPADVEVKPGKHTVHFEAPNYVATSVEVEASFAETKDVATALEKKAEPPPPVAEKTPEPPPAPPPPPPEPRSKVPAYVTGGLALASVGLGTAFGILALKDKSQFDESLNNPTRAEELANRGDNRALVADMAFAAALTLGVTSLVLFLTKDETVVETKAGHAYTIKKAARRVPVIVPVATPSGGGAGAVFQF